MFPRYAPDRDRLALSGVGWLRATLEVEGERKRGFVGLGDGLLGL